MGVWKSKRPILLPKGARFTGTGGDLRMSVETKTGSSVPQTLSAVGVSIITYGTSGKGNAFILPVPPAAGSMKKIIVNKNTSSEELDINTNATANVFYGTTFNTVTIAASTVNTMGSVALDLVGCSTSQWAVTAGGSTIIWDFSASTGSSATL